MTQHHDSSGANATLRLLIPQWQGGGNHPTYALGARLLAWLASLEHSLRGGSYQSLN
jgi:hypothetical protein